MHRIHIQILTALVATFVLIFAGLMSTGYAQDNSGSIDQERAAVGVAQEESDEMPPSTAVSEDRTIIGIVDKIELTGQLATSRSVVLNQMTFKIGDAISRHDIDRSRSRILSLNGIYWQANITWAEASEQGHITVAIDLRSRRTWFISPSYPSGAAIGDRNFLHTGDSLSFGVFIDSANQDYLWTLLYTDPQFLGGHNSMTLEAHTLDTQYSIRTDRSSTGESYFLDRRGFTLVYGTRWREKVNVSVVYKWDSIDALKNGDPFKKLGTDDKFYFSGAEIPDGHVGVLALDMSRGTINSIFFPTHGYYWDAYNEFSNSLTASDFNFTRHTVSGAVFSDIYRKTNVLGAHMVYACMTGDPPDYERLPFDWQVRGYSLGVHRGMSLFATNLEYRFIAEPGIFQGVVFADLGRSWDKQVFSLNGLEFGYGIGIRIYTSTFIPYNLLLRIDYGWSDSGEEFTFGFNQFF